VPDDPPPSDAELLKGLGRCLRAGAIEPPTASVAELRARADILAGSRLVVSRRRFSWPRSWWASVVVAGMVTMGAGTAFAAGAPVDNLNRRLARGRPRTVSRPKHGVKPWR